MIFKTTTNVYDEINEAKAKSKEDLLKAIEDLNAAKTRKKEAEDVAAVALVNGDDLAYKAARNAERDADDDIELLTYRVTNLEKGVIFTESERVELLRRIDEEIGKTKTAKVPQLARLIDEAADIAEEIRAELVKEAEAKDIVNNDKTMGGWLEVQGFAQFVRQMEALKKTRLLQS